MKQDDKGPYIQLCDFLKVKGVSQTGGQAKILIRSGDVSVNGESDTRNKRKLRKGDEVSVGGKTYPVEAELFGKE